MHGRLRLVRIVFLCVVFHAIGTVVAEESEGFSQKSPKSAQASSAAVALSSQPALAKTAASPVSPSSGAQVAPFASTSSSSQPLAKLEMVRASGDQQVLSQESEKPVDWLARCIAVCGILLAGWNVYAANQKAKRDRRLSVEDDFWFRKIITPSTLEPIVETTVELVELMPTGSSTPDDQRDYALLVTKEFLRFYHLVQALALYDESLPRKVAENLRECEDSLMDYCASLAAAQNGDAPDTSAAQARVWALVAAAFKTIKQAQLAQR